MQEDKNRAQSERKRSQKVSHGRGTGGGDPYVMSEYTDIIFTIMDMHLVNKHDKFS